MIRLDVIEIAEPSSDALDALKAYAAVSDSGNDSLLMMVLRTAFDKVQRAADVALLDGRFRLCVDEHLRSVSVYMGGKVESVTNGNGLPVSHIQNGRRVWLGTDEYVEVEFTTTANPAGYARYMPVVCQYATALYDGQDEKVLNGILKQCL